MHQKLIDTSNLSKGKGLFSYTNLQTENVKKCIEEALDFQGKRKFILKEDLDLFVASLVFMKGASCSVIRRY